MIASAPLHSDDCPHTETAFLAGNGNDDFALKQKTSLHASVNPTQPHPQWTAFDLDDTLHDFNQAYRVATQAVFKRICNLENRVAVDDLQSAYEKICKTTVAQFTDGRTSHEYRDERMRALLGTFGIADISPQDCVDTYAAAFKGALRLNAGVRDVLRALHEGGTHIAVITEAPHDAQERTLRDLHIVHYVDVLITSNKERLSKKDGLFERYARMCGVDPARTFVIGDSEENDILPGNAAGMRTIHYAPAGKYVSPHSLGVIGHFSELRAKITEISA